MITVGNYNEFIVDRKTDIGYMLKNKDEEILLHEKQMAGKTLEVGDKVFAFVMYDSKGRQTATLEEAICTTNSYGFATVVDVKVGLGVFLNINTFKDVLLSKDDLPQDITLWPQIGDKILIKLQVKNNRIKAVMGKRDDLILYYPLKEHKLGEVIEAYVCRCSNLAINACSLDKNYIFISTKQFREKHRIGEKVNVMIIGAHEAELVGSLNKVKEEMVLDDELQIIAYLNKHNGVMPYTAKTDSETIERVFHMSRKAFKRALGDLYKKEEIICNDLETKLNEKKA